MRKNSLIILITFFGYTSFLLANQQENQLTDMVMTMLSDSANLDHKLAALPKSKTFSCVLVAADENIYTGLRARLFSFLHRMDKTVFLFRKTALSAFFKLTQVDEQVEIASDIKISQALINRRYRTFGDKEEGNQEQVLKDNYSKCKIMQEKFVCSQTLTESSQLMRCKTTFSSPAQFANYLALVRQKNN